MKEEILCKEVERVAGRKMQTPRDYEWLCEKIQQRTGERISPTTLQRLWGYLPEDVKPRQVTLNVLAQYVGVKDYNTFCEVISKGGETQSNLVFSKRLSSEDLYVGEQVCLTWLPDRRCVVEYKGNGSFVVVEKENTKLSVGDTFKCHLIIEGEPLFLDHLIHDNAPPTGYVAGRMNGVRFEVR